MSRRTGLIFDLDDTLYDSDRAYHRALASVGFGFRDPRYLKARAAVKARLPARHVSARNRLLYLKTAMEHQNRYSPAAVLARMDRYERHLRADIARQWRALRRARLFARLRRRFPMVVLSNENTRTQLVKLAAIDPRARFFKRLITSEEIGREKPHRRMFQAALAHLGLRAADCVMIGDNVDDDIRPALALGMRAVLTREFAKAPAPRRRGFAVIGALNDLEAVLP